MMHVPRSLQEYQTNTAARATNPCHDLKGFSQRASVHMHNHLVSSCFVKAHTQIYAKHQKPYRDFR